MVPSTTVRSLSDWSSVVVAMKIRKMVLSEDFHSWRGNCYIPNEGGWNQRFWWSTTQPVAPIHCKASETDKFLQNYLVSVNSLYSDKNKFAGNILTCSWLSCFYKPNTPFPTKQVKKQTKQAHIYSKICDLEILWFWKVFSAFPSVNLLWGGCLWKVSYRCDDTCNVLV